MAVGIAFARETSHAWYGVELRFAAGAREGLSVYRLGVGLSLRAR